MKLLHLYFIELYIEFVQVHAIPIVIGMECVSVLNCPRNGFVCGTNFQSVKMHDIIIFHCSNLFHLECQQHH